MLVTADLLWCPAAADGGPLTFFHRLFYVQGETEVLPSGGCLKPFLQPNVRQRHRWDKYLEPQYDHMSYITLLLSFLNSIVCFNCCCCYCRQHCYHPTLIVFRPITEKVYLQNRRHHRIYFQWEEIGCFVFNIISDNVRLTQNYALAVAKHLAPINYTVMMHLLRRYSIFFYLIHEYFHLTV